MDNRIRLTDKQRELISNNHDLIYWFAHKKNISVDDYYDILAIGLCKAASIFDNDKGKFSTLAYRCMNNELFMHWKSLNKKSAIPDSIVLSYDAANNGAISGSALDISKILVENKENESMVYNVIVNEFIESLTETESNIVRMLLTGMSQVEIAEILGCKRQNVGYYVKIIRKKAVDYIYKY